MIYNPVEHGDLWAADDSFKHELIEIAWFFSVDRLIRYARWYYRFCVRDKDGYLPIEVRRESY